MEEITSDDRKTKKIKVEIKHQEVQAENGEMVLIICPFYVKLNQ